MTDSETRKTIETLCARIAEIFHEEQVERERQRALGQPTFILRGKLRTLADERYALQREAAICFGKSRGWKRADQSFSLEALAKNSLRSTAVLLLGRPYDRRRDQTWADTSIDHPECFRLDRRAVAIVAHNYGHEEAAVRLGLSVGVRVSFPDLPSWYYPERTTLTLFEYDAGYAQGVSDALRMAELDEAVVAFAIKAAKEGHPLTSGDKIPLWWLHLMLDWKPTKRQASEALSAACWKQLVYHQSSTNPKFPSGFYAAPGPPALQLPGAGG